MNEAENANGNYERRLRMQCRRNSDYVPILTSAMTFTRITCEDLTTIQEYGWNENDLERMLNSGDAADQITRLAAWIREAGEIDHGMVVEDDPYVAVMDNRYCGYELDEDGNYPEVA